jgi:two-component system response regulator NreC
MIALMSTPIRVLLAEDHTIVREGLKALLDGRGDMIVVAEADNGHAAVIAAKQHRPDIVVMDLKMPRLNGVDATKAIRSALPGTHVVILSMYSTAEHVRPAIRAGANGYLLKGSGLADLVAAIKAVAAGNVFFSPEVARVVLEDAPLKVKLAGSDREVSELTGRERQILKLVAEGRSSPEIARDLNLSIKTVEGHRSRVMSKLDAKNVAGLVRHAIRLGLVSPES